MLIIEYNFLKKALIYMNNKESKVLPSEYKKCYDIWQIRQFFIHNLTSPTFSKLKKGDTNLGCDYIPSFILKGTFMYREICEDFLYVTLNILLAKNILRDTKINKYINNEELFNINLKSILNKHHKKYKIEYDCLSKVREYTCYNFMSLNTLEKNFKG